jgi:hypothetical protein
MPFVLIRVAVVSSALIRWATSLTAAARILLTRILSGWESCWSSYAKASQTRVNIRKQFRRSDQHQHDLLQQVTRIENLDLADHAFGPKRRIPDRLVQDDVLNHFHFAHADGNPWSGNENLGRTVVTEAGTCHGH